MWAAHVAPDLRGIFSCRKTTDKTRPNKPTPWQTINVFNKRYLKQGAHNGHALNLQLKKFIITIFRIKGWLFIVNDNSCQVETRVVLTLSLATHAAAGALAPPSVLKRICGKSGNIHLREADSMPETSNNTVGEFTLFSQPNFGGKNTATNCCLQHRLSIDPQNH